MDKTVDWTEALISAGLATVATTAVAAFLGKREADSMFAPINAVSHIAWGDEAAEADKPDVRHTGVGFLLHAGAMLTWSLVQEFFFSRMGRKRDIRQELAAGALTSGLAYVTDYKLVPKRLTPGFELRLSNKSLAVIYLALAAGLTAGLILRKGDRS